MAVYRFLLEEVFFRYRCVGQVVAELDSNEAKEFFAKYGVRLTLNTTYNSEANGHGPIVKLVKSSNGNVKIWPLVYALWVDRTTLSSMTGYMPAELMTRLMPVEITITAWEALQCTIGMRCEDLLAVRIR